jgi:AhpD family alkylhydroperoxidase
VTPRIRPGSRRELGVFGWGFAQLSGRVAGTAPPNLFTTLGRHRSLFRGWLWFAGRLMPGGKLPRADTELVILRVAHNCDCAYEWAHHERIAPVAGVGAEQIAAVALAVEDGPWTARQALLLRAADELHHARVLSDSLWAELSGQLTPVELIELCMLIGHYEMLAMTINSLGIEPDAVLRAPGKLVR